MGGATSTGASWSKLRSVHLPNSSSQFCVRELSCAELTSQLQIRRVEAMWATTWEPREARKYLDVQVMMNMPTILIMMMMLNLDADHDHDAEHES